MRKKLYLGFCALVLFTMSALAQTLTVTGKITDEKGAAIAGASIIEKGTKKGTGASNEGVFSIAVKKGATLIISAIGFETKQITASSTMSIQLVTTSSALSEVVVVAYGTQKKESFTGSVAVVKSDLLNDRPVTSVDKALQGAAAGVSVQSTSGQPGAATTVRIRGVGSFNASNAPLYVVDGVAVTTGDFTQSAQTANVLSSIDPNDVESISVLKDASASALYGSRAGNGVILITTKKGKAGKTKVNFTSNYGQSTIAVKKHEVMSGTEYFKYWWDGFYRTRVAAGDAPAVAATKANASTITALGANPYDNANPFNETGLNAGVGLLYNHEWTDDITRKGITQDYTLSVSGGNDKSNFFISGGYFDQKGITLASDYKRYSVRVNLENKATSYLKFGINSALSHSEQNTPPGAGGAANPIRFADITSSVYPLYRLDAAGLPIPDPLGGFAYNYRTPISFDYNPVGLAIKNIYNAKTVRAILNAYMEVDFFKGLKFRSQGAADLIDIRETQYYNPVNGDGSGVKGRTNKYAPRDLVLTLTNTLVYDKRFGEHTVNFLVGQEAVKYRYDNLIAGGTTFPFDGIVELASAGVPTTASSSSDEKRLASYFSRLNYSFQNKYFLSGSLRRDGSSVFGADNRYGIFWSVGGAWRVSEEKFMAGASSWLTELKVRGSYGKSGNDNIGRNARLGLYSTGNNYGGASGTAYTQLENPALQWEGNTVTDIGLEFVLFKKIKAELGYFNRGSQDILFNKPLSYTTGFSSILTNLATMKNYGFEGLVEASIVSKKSFSWDVSANITVIKNEIQKMTVDSLIQTASNQIWRVGKDRYQFFIREYAGVDAADGKPMWYQDDASGKKVAIKDWNSATRYYKGSALPKFYGGLTNKFKFRNFDANIFIFFSVGGQIYDNTLATQMHGGTGRGQQFAKQAYNAWTKAGDITDVPRFLDKNTDLGANASTRFMFDGSYVRLKSLNIGYSIPKSLVDKYGISNVRFFVSAENILTIAKHKGMDPEVEITGANNNDIPNIKTVSVGLNIGL